MPNLDLASLIRTVPDFPRKGVRFRDITTMFKDAAGFRAVVERLADAHRGAAIDKVVGIESRGFIVGAALASELRVGFVPVRKAGRLPAENFGRDYELEYGRDRLELHRDALAPGERVLVVDDLIATGGTASAALALCAMAEASVVGCAFVIDLPDLGGRARLDREGVRSVALCAFAGH
jgi:adenine phosphoribosyltransferase